MRDATRGVGSIAQRVTGQIRTALTQGVRPWVQPFTAMPPPLPRRSNGEPYRGSNLPTLWAAAWAAGFISPFWFTYKQAASFGAHVRRGERSSFVVFYSPSEARRRQVASTPPEETSDCAPSRASVLRGYAVFNADQIEGLPQLFTTAVEGERIGSPICSELAAAFTKVPARLVLSNRAFYRPSTDTVHMPPLSAFRTPTHYYSTLAHELAHWTSHPSRLNRDFASRRYGDASYALEELTAELTAAIVGAVLCLPVDHIEDHSSYIASWLEVLSDDPSAFVTAAGKAQVAADYLLGAMQAH